MSNLDAQEILQHWNHDCAHQVPEASPAEHKAFLDRVDEFHFHAASRETTLRAIGPVYESAVDKGAVAIALSHGLSSLEVLRRRIMFGDNFIAKLQGRSTWDIVFDQFINPVTIIMAGVFAISAVYSQWIEAVVVVLVVVLNSGIGIFQEITAESSMAAMRAIAKDQGELTVVRDNRRLDIETHEIVLGDIVELRTGRVVPADMRLLSVSGLQIDESILTGESQPVEKTVDPLPEPDMNLGIGDRTNMAFRQTNVTQGVGIGVVVAIGLRTEIGKIQERLNKRTDSTTPLMHSVNAVMQICLIIGIVFGVFIIWAFGWKLTAASLLYASATLVAILPEAAFVIITVVMSLGAKRMARANAIVRRASSLELVGSVTDICSDKTGTLTMGQMAPAAVVLCVPRKKKNDSMKPANGTEDDHEHKQIAKDEDECCIATYNASTISVSGLVLLSIEGLPRSADSKWFKGLPDGNARQQSLPLLSLAEVLEDESELNDTRERMIAWQRLLMIAHLCSNTNIQNVDNTLVTSGGNPTEIALQVLVHKANQALPNLHSTYSLFNDDQNHAHGDEERKGHSIITHAYAHMSQPTFSHATSICSNEMKPFTFMDMLKDELEPRGEWSFDSSHKRMSTGWLHRDKHTSFVLTKGGPDVILPLCVGLSKETADIITLHLSKLGRKGLRVIALAYREDLDLRHALLQEIGRENVEKNLTLAGLVAIRDPPKPKSSASVELCKRAGIAVRMLTGDHQDTAVAIAQEIGILPPSLDNLPASAVMSGQQLDCMTCEQLDALESLPVVVARSSPQSKVAMVEALHRRKRIVAMTGDGVNDSMAVKTSDVGIVMGIAGSDVTKSVADIVLADDDFSTIVSAVQEGRQIFDSIVKFMLHLLTGNMAEAVALMIALGLVRDETNSPVFVLSPMSILWINTATGMPALALAFDPPAVDLMDRKPIRDGVFTLQLIADCFFYGALMGTLTLGAFFVQLQVVGKNYTLGSHCNEHGSGCDDVHKARGAAFLFLNTTLSLHAFVCRHSLTSMFAMPIWDNTTLLWSVGISVILNVPLLHIPWLSDTVLQQQGTSTAWLITFVGVVIYFFCAEMYKAIRRSYASASAIAEADNELVDEKAEMMDYYRNKDDLVRGMEALQKENHMLKQQIAELLQRLQCVETNVGDVEMPQLTGHE